MSEAGFWRRRVTGGSPDEGVLKKWLDRLANALKRLTGKTDEVLPAIAGSVIGATLSFLGKAVGFVEKHTWVLIFCCCRACWLVVDAKS